MPAHEDLSRRPTEGGLRDGDARFRRLHLEMIAAVVADGGLERLAQLASAEVNAPVAILVPRLGDALDPPDSINQKDLANLRRYVQARVAKRPVELPKMIAGETPISTGDEVVGAVLLIKLEGGERPSESAPGALSVTAIAVLTELAVAGVREETQDALRGSLIELICGNPELPDEEILRRAYRLGSDLSQGAVALCAELNRDRPRQVMDTIRSEQPEALAEHLDHRVYALIPPEKGKDPATAAPEVARRLAEALAPGASVGVSSFCSQPHRFYRAIQEAELVLDVLKHQTGDDATDVHSAVYRLLFRAVASHPDEVKRFYEDTVAPLVRYDESYHADLVGTVEAYFAHNCNMNATAAGIYAHRHTIAYRLERVRELTGLDPSISEDRERLGLGLKAYRILASRLQR
jgi:PucR C-terminal helix-turn-helix domain/GGDEF-like domain